VRKADNLPPSCAVVTKSGNLNFLEPSGPLQACNGTDLPLHRCTPHYCVLSVDETTALAILRFTHLGHHFLSTCPSRSYCTLCKVLRCGMLKQRIAQRIGNCRGARFTAMPTLKYFSVMVKTCSFHIIFGKVLHLQIIRFVLSKHNGLHAVTLSCPTMRVISSEPSRISSRYLYTDFVLNVYIACSVSLHAAILLHLHETQYYSEPSTCHNNWAVIRC